MLTGTETGTCITTTGCLGYLIAPKKIWKKSNTFILFKIEQYKEGKITKEKLLESFQGWNAYAKWANSFKLRREVVRKIYASNLSTL